MSAVPVSERTRVRRKPQRGSYDRAVIDAILDEALICHVGVAAEHGPLVIPTMFVRVGDRVFLHGSVGSHLIEILAGGAEACVTVTLLDALVLARTAIHHSLNYRSVVIFGRAEPIDEPVPKLAALAAMIDRAAPRRSAACRPPNAKELARTRVVALPITEASAKSRSGPPLPDEGEDAALPFWAGIIPLVTLRGSPISSPDCTVHWEDTVPR